MPMPLILPVDSPSCESKQLVSVTTNQRALIDGHMHLSLGYADLKEQNYQKRMSSSLGKLCIAQDISKLHIIQEPLVEHVLSLFNSEPTLQLHVQSVSYIDSVFNYALLSHPMLQGLLNRSLFLYVGIHPWFLSADTKQASQELYLLVRFIERLSSCDVLTGLGEIGLDKLAGADISLQQNILSELLEFNKNTNLDLPVSLHCCKAHNELLTVLSRFYKDKSTSQLQAQTNVEAQNNAEAQTKAKDQTHAKQLFITACNGLIHGFNGSVQIGQRYCELNFRLGLGLMWARKERFSKLMQLLKALEQFGQPVVTESDFDQQSYELAPLKDLANHLAQAQQELSF